MKKIKYTPDAADKLRDMKNTIAAQYGSKKDSWRNQARNILSWYDGMKNTVPTWYQKM